ncbi:MAG: FG-GAP-like repeat-containing protein [Cyanobacteria bacterium P01_F01_bin.86]
MLDNSNNGSSNLSTSQGSAVWQNEWIDAIWGQLVSETYSGLDNVVVEGELEEAEARLQADLTTLNQILVGQERRSVLEIQNYTSSTGFNPAIDALTGSLPVAQSLANVLQHTYQQGLPDLVAEIGNSSLSEVAEPGERGRISVTVRNQGGLRTRMPVTLKLFASENDTLDETAFEIGERSWERLTLNPNRQRNVSVQVQLPDTLNSGDYNIFAVIDTADNVPESNETNNITVSAQSQVVVGSEPEPPPVVPPTSGSSPLPFSVRAEGRVTVNNGNSDFDGDPLLPEDDALIYGGRGFVLNGQPVLPVQRDANGDPLLDEQGRPLLIDNAVAVSAEYTTSNAPNNQYGGLIPPQIVENQTVEVPSHDELVTATLAQQIPEGVTPIDFSPNGQPLYNLQTWTENFPPGGTVENPAVIRITGGGLNIPNQVNLENTIFLVENGDINFNGNGHQLNNVTLVTYNGGMRFSSVVGNNLTVMASRQINMNGGSTFSGESLIASQNAVTFNGTTSAPSDRLKVVSQGNITFNGTSDTRAEFLAAGNFRFNSNATLRGSIHVKGDITFNGQATVFADSDVPTDTTAPLLTLALFNNTGDSADTVTSVATVVGTVADESDIVRLSAGFGDTPVANFVDISQYLQDGSFTLERAALETVLGAPLIDGSYTLKVIAEDRFGNVSEPISYDYTLDTQAPTLAVTELRTVDTEDGFIRLIGSVDEPALVTVRLAETDPISFGVNIAGDFERALQSVPTAIGTYALGVTLTDTAGNISQSSLTFEVTPVDSSAPLVALALTDDTGNSDDAVTSVATILGTVTDESDIVGLKAGFGDIETADFIDISQYLQNGSFTLDTVALEAVLGTSLVDGTYTLRVIAEDRFGNVSVPTVYDFTLDTSIPVATVVLTEDTGANVDDQITASPEITVNVTDLGSSLFSLRAGFDDTEPSNFVDVLDLLQSDGTVSLDATLISQINGGPLADGAHSLNLTATDVAGNITEVSLSFIQDTLAPVLSASLLEDTGAATNDQITSVSDTLVTVSEPISVTTLTASLEGGNANNFVDILDALQPDGTVRLNSELFNQLGGGSLTDGQYTLNVIATDVAGNISLLDFAFTLDTTTLTASTQGVGSGSLSAARTFVDINYGEVLTEETFNPNNYGLTAVDQAGETQSVEINSVSALGGNRVRLSFDSPLEPGTYTLELDASIEDIAGNVLANTALSFEISPVSVQVMPFDGEERVNPKRETVVQFGSAVDPTTVTDDSFYLIAGGRRVPGRIEVSSTEEFATFFAEQPLPSSTAIRVVVDGAQILTRSGNPLDVDGDGIVGGLLTSEFRTLSLDRIENTDLSGYIYDSFNTNPDGSNIPIIGATLRVQGVPEISVQTDETGFFLIEDVPAPRIFVEIDGSTATNAPEGASYVSLSEAFTTIAGQSVSLTDGAGETFDIFLPTLPADDIQTLSETETTQVRLGASSLAQLQTLLPDVAPALLDVTQVTFAPGSALDDQGNQATQASIIAVDPNRLPGALPDYLNPRAVFSIQAGGIDGFNGDGGATRFDVPASVIFPNLEGLAPGEQSLLFSFNHDSGQFEVIGTGTVSADGLAIESDPGVGIAAPGWHFALPGVRVKGGDIKSDPDEPEDCNGRPCYDQEIHLRLKTFIPAPLVSLFPVVLTNQKEQNAFLFGEGGILQSGGENVTEFIDYYNQLTDTPLLGAAGEILEGIISAADETIRDIPSFIRDLFNPNLDNRIRGAALEALSEAIEPLYDDSLILAIGEESEERQVLPPLVFGDNRGFSFGSPSYRSIHDLAITVDPEQNKIVGLEPFLEWGPSLTYANFVGRPVAGRPFWFWDFVSGEENSQAFVQNTITEDDENINVTVIRPDSTSARVEFFLDGSDPVIPGAPDLSADITLLISQTPGSRAEYKLLGSHDAFPAYELYINEEQIYGHNPLDTGDSPWDLFDPKTIKLNDPRYRSIPFGEVVAAQSSPQASTAPPLPVNSLADDAILLPTSNGLLEDDSQTVLLTQTGDHYFAIRDLDSGEIIQRGITPNGDILNNVFLAQDRSYQALVLQPGSLKVGSTLFTTPESGSSLELDEVVISNLADPIDTDGDGLNDTAEIVLGTNANEADTNGDGISDLAALEQGLDPVAGLNVSTGVVGSLSVTGSTNAVVVEGSRLNDGQRTAYLATSEGIAIADVSQFDEPIRLGELDLPGTSRDISADSALQIAAVASSGGLYLVDISDPLQPTRIGTILGAYSHVEVFESVAYVASNDSLIAIDLITGKKLQTLDFTEFGPVTGLAREGRNLYTYTSDSDIFSSLVIEQPGQLTLLDQLGVSVASSDVGVFVGNGTAYLAGGGIRAIDVSDPSNISLVGNANNFFTARDIALNGSGLALVALEDQGVGVFDLSDPQNTAALVATFDTSGFALDVFIAEGLGFVADGSGDLQIVNYLPFDSQGQAPTLTISAGSDLDFDANTDGIQVIEGSSFSIQSTISDDVQIRNAELLINGEVVRNDVSFPFDLEAIAPNITSQSNSATIQVRVTDTGGNITFSDSITLQLVPNIIAPELIDISPAAGDRLSRIQVVEATFSEPLAVETINPETFQVINSQGIVISPAAIQLSDDEQLVRLVFIEPLNVDEYQIVIDAAIVSDRAGNLLGTEPVINSFTVHPVVKANIVGEVDLDANTEGIQVEEGSSLSVQAFIGDDVQVQNAELLINDVVVSNDSSFPFEFNTEIPGLVSTSDIATIQVRVTDNEGNIDLSDPVTVELLPDVTPPVLLQVVIPSNNVIEAEFSEPLAVETISAETFRVVNSQDIVIDFTAIQLSDNNQTVRLVFSEPLSPDDYQLAIESSMVSDREGNLLATESDYIYEFSILSLGNGEYVLASTQPPTDSAQSYSVGLGDFDGDGDVDAFVANIGINNQVLLNDGSGGFTESAEQPPGAFGNSFRVSVGDLDGDDDLDIFVSNVAQANQVLLNDGSGNFSTSVSQPPGLFGQSTSASLGDIDGDGDLDAFITNFGNNQILLNDGVGGFSEAAIQPMDNALSYDVDLGDIDGDGDLDAFVVNLQGANQVFLNNGSGVFVEAPTQPPGLQASTNVSLGDLNGDGHLDAFVVNDTDANQVLINDGSGEFTEVSTQPLGVENSIDVELGDVDSDGDLDAFVVNSDSRPNQLLLNDGTGIFTEAPTQPPSNSELSYGVGFADLDGDTDLDVFVTNSGSSNQVLINSKSDER